MKRILNFDVKQYVKHVFAPSFRVMGILGLFVLVYMKLDVTSLLGHVVGLAVEFFATSIIIYYADLGLSERELINNILICRIKKR